MRDEPWPNQSPEPTAVGAVSSAIAVHIASRRWLSSGRWRSIIMEYSDPQLVSKVRKFKRTMTLWGLPYSMLGMWILATVWNAIVPPQPASPFEVILFLVGVFVLVLLPLWWMSHYLRKRYGLICRRMADGFQSGVRIV